MSDGVQLHRSMKCLANSAPKGRSTSTFYFLTTTLRASFLWIVMYVNSVTVR